MISENKMHFIEQFNPSNFYLNDIVINVVSNGSLSLHYIQRGEDSYEILFSFSGLVGEDVIHKISHIMYRKRFTNESWEHAMDSPDLFPSGERIWKKFHDKVDSKGFLETFVFDFNFFNKW